MLTGIIAAGLFVVSQPAQAATGINKTINFQGRLLNAQGATVPDGYYNIQFKIYQDGDGQSVGNTTGSPAGTLKWTESHLNANSQGVTVKNGYARNFLLPRKKALRANAANKKVFEANRAQIEADNAKRTQQMYNDYDCFQHFFSFLRRDRSHRIHPHSRRPHQ